MPRTERRATRRSSWRSTRRTPATSTGCALGQAGNPNLKPETTREIELGADFTLFDRLGVEFTHALTTTKNQILPVPTAATLGFSTQWQNAGTLASHTWEAALNLPVINRRNFSWNMRGTWDRTTYVHHAAVRARLLHDWRHRPGHAAASFFMTAKTQKMDGYQMNQFGNVWGRQFYKGCGIAADVGPG